MAISPAAWVMRAMALLVVYAVPALADHSQSSPVGVPARSLLNKPPAPAQGASRWLESLTISGKDEVCVAITGGAGQIAYALLPLIVHGRVFGEGRKVRLRLLDIEPCSGALQGVAMEIMDCYSELVTEVVTTCDPEVAFEGADVAVLLGGFPRLPGIERRDLIAKNVPIMAEHGRALAKCASEGVRVLVVANPACTNCLIASISAPSIPRSHFSSLARLDQDRLSAMLAEELSSEAFTATASHHQERQEPMDLILAPSPVAVRGAYLWGNHSPTMWPDVSQAELKIGGRWVPIEKGAVLKHGGIRDPVVATDAEVDVATATWREWVRETLVPAVRERGTRVIEARGKSSALSAANAIANHLKDWLSCPAGASGEVSMGVFSDGNPYGVPDGLVCSFPVECGEGRHRILKGFQPDGAMLEASAQELVDERQEVLSFADSWSFVDAPLTYFRGALKACPGLRRINIDSYKRPISEVLDLAYAILTAELLQLKYVCLTVPVVAPKGEPWQAIGILPRAAAVKAPPVMLEVGLA